MAPLAHLFVDAAGKSSRWHFWCGIFGCLSHVRIVRRAAVLFIDGAVYFTDGVPNVEILDKFQNRNDR